MKEIKIEHSSECPRTACIETQCIYSSEEGQILQKIDDLSRSLDEPDDSNEADVTDDSDASNDSYNNNLPKFNNFIWAYICYLGILGLW